MRKWLLLALLLAVVAPRSAFAAGPDIIVDNRDPGFSTQGHWYVGDGGHSYGGDCAWAPRGIQFFALFDPRLPVGGSYEVFGWWPGDPHHDQSNHTRIYIYQTPGDKMPHQVWVNFQQDVGRWVSLGTYYLGPGSTLQVTGNLGGNVVADAFRFSYRSPDRVVITPTPAPTLVPWSNHPPSPLEQLTSGDLSQRLGLVQRFYPYTPVTASEAMFDDCQAFPRAGCGGRQPGWNATVQYEDMAIHYRISKDYRYRAVEATAALTGRQVLYLAGTKGDRFFRVDRYPDDTWGLSGGDVAGTYAGQVPLDATDVSRLKSFIQAYGSVVLQTPGGVGLTLYGLGTRVEISAEDAPSLAALGDEFAAAVWP